MATDNPNLDLELLAKDMAFWARENVHSLGVAVVSVITVINRNTSEVSQKDGSYATRLTHIPDPQNRGEDDPGTNHMATAHAKVDKRLRMELGNDTQDPAVRRGEDKATGDAAAWLSDSLLVIAAYFGCPTPEEDRVVANYGLNQFHQQTLSD